MLFEVLYTFVLDDEVKRPGMHVDIDDYDTGMRLLEIGAVVQVPEAPAGRRRSGYGPVGSGAGPVGRCQGRARQAETALVDERVRAQVDELREDDAVRRAMSRWRCALAAWRGR